MKKESIDLSNSNASAASQVPAFGSDFSQYLVEGIPTEQFFKLSPGEITALLQQYHKERNAKERNLNLIIEELTTTVTDMALSFKELTGREDLIGEASHFDDASDDVSHSDCEKNQDHEVPKLIYRENWSKLFPLLFPISKVIAHYSWVQFRADIQSAVTVAFVIIPQAIAFSSLAGVDPFTALISAIFPPLFYSIFGSSRHLSVGPEALSSVLVGIAISHELSQFQGDANVIASIMACLVGLFAITLVVFQIVFIENILSGFFLTGFVLGIANLIIIEQIPNLVGITVIREHTESTFELLVKCIQQFGDIKAYTAILGFVCLLFLLSVKYLKKRFKKRYPKIIQIPEILVLVILSIVMSCLFDFKNIGIKVLGDIKTSLPVPTPPPINGEIIIRLLPAAIVITVVGFVESQTVTRNFGLKKGYFPMGSGELLALGTTNALASFFGCYPTFGSLPRSRILFNSGGETVLVGFMVGLIVLVSTTTLGWVLKFLPLATLSAIVTMAAINLIEYDEIYFLFKMKKVQDFFMFAVSWGLTIFIPIQSGVMICMGIAAAFILSKTTDITLSLVGKISYPFRNGKKVRDVFVDVRDNSDAELVDGILIISVLDSLEFFNAGDLRKKIQAYMSAHAYLRHETAMSMIHDTFAPLQMKPVESRTIRKIVLDFNHCDSVVSIC
jgi:high affinity sulfate transporter 1